jgi:hypothetical protein
LRLPEDLDYFAIPNLSMEERIRLTRAKPLTIGAASRISGIRMPTLIFLTKYCVSQAKKEKLAAKREIEYQALTKFSQQQKDTGNGC